MRPFYLALTVLGAVVPYSQFVPWLAANGLDLRRFAAELFSTQIGAFFGLDVIVAAVVLIAFILAEGARVGVRHLWLPVLATGLVGVSCALPLFLYLREARVARPAGS